MKLILRLVSEVDPSVRKKAEFQLKDTDGTLEFEKWIFDNVEEIRKQEAGLEKMVNVKVRVIRF